VPHLQADRSLERLAERDLARLAELAARDRVDRFRRKPRWSIYADRVICVALCQGAALHYVDGSNGIKDLDVWTFYAEHDVGPFPARWRTTADFGPSRFGRWSGDPEAFVGRRVDLIGRSLSEPVCADPARAMVKYLRAGRTASARALAAKAVVLLDPEPFRGAVVWPPEASASRGERPLCF
jgi:hypothetical protein